MHLGNVNMILFCHSIKTRATKRVNKGVNDELNAIYSIIEKTPGLKALTIASELIVSLSTVEKYIK